MRFKLVHDFDIVTLVTFSCLVTMMPPGAAASGNPVLASAYPVGLRPVAAGLLQEDHFVTDL